ncbi:MAG: NfeD family protein [Oscillospiraceae bacterium]|nr:NfeD family protein [Oscillospiraceae bacterium]
MDTVIWFALLLLFIWAEAATVTMVSAWFAIGALAAVIAALADGQLWLQITLFLGVSGVSLALLRPIARKYFDPKITRTNVDAMVGKICLVVADIDNPASQGQVKIGDVEWSARSADGTPIPAGTQVKIHRVEGVKVYVTPVTVAVK